MKTKAPISNEEQAEIGAVLSDYYSKTCGSVKSLFRNTVGNVNKTFIIETPSCCFVLRESSRQKNLAHLMFEVEVLNYLQKQGFAFTPRIIPNDRGEPVTLFKGRYYMMQNYMTGEIKASWNDLEHFTDGMLESFFRLSAKFTKAAQGFSTNSRSENRPVSFYVENAESLLSDCIKKIPNSPGRKLIDEKRPEVGSFMKVTDRECRISGYGSLPKQLVHFDLHPGNVHFIGEKAVALFDFDWVRFDSRISDIAATICQACYYFGNGFFRKDKILLGLSTYRRAYGPSEFTSAEENRLIKIALKGYVFFQLLWALDWYKDCSQDDYGFVVVRHFVNLLLLNDYEKLFS